MANVALVTGAASRIGRATAQLRGERRYHVVAGDLRYDGAVETIATLASAMAVELDVRSPQAAARCHRG